MPTLTLIKGERGLPHRPLHYYSTAEYVLLLRELDVILRIQA